MDFNGKFQKIPRDRKSISVPRWPISTYAHMKENAKRSTAKRASIEDSEDQPSQSGAYACRLCVARYRSCTDTTKEKTNTGKATTADKGMGRSRVSMSDEELKSASCTGGLRYL